MILELLIIVIGVFIALASESWWSERQDRVLESNLRSDMAAEFAANIKILESDIQQNEGSMAHFAQLPNLSHSALLDLTDEELNRNYRPFPNWNGFDPEMGIAQALVGSGNLSSIKDRHLRLLLSRWAGLLAEKDRKTLQAAQFTIGSLMPAIAEVSADSHWTDAERRRIQSLYATFVILTDLVLANQHRLIEEAQSAHAYLAGETR